MVISISAPATSANLGPGFDSLGLAWDFHDQVTFAEADRTTIAVTGAGAEAVPTDESHLVVRTFLQTLDELGHHKPAGISFQASNSIPHGRGLGSSSAAIVSGLLGGWHWVHGNQPAPTQWLLERGLAIEGHLDNIAPAVLGGLTVSVPTTARAVPFRVDQRIGAVLFVPEYQVLTTAARQALPQSVPLSAAVRNIGNAALLLQVLSAADSDLDLDLFLATQDQLHQPYRAKLMLPSADLLTRLRDQGWAAVISGAGPTVLVLGERSGLAALPEEPGFRRMSLTVGAGAKVEVA